jgi:RNAse (barnase) inhibitor barstar
MGYFFVREMSKINQIFNKDDVRETLDSILSVLRSNTFIPFPLEMVNQAFYHSSRYSEAIAQDYKKNYTLTIKRAIEKLYQKLKHLNNTSF